MNLESNITSINKPTSYIFNALTQVHEYQKLMPDSIAKFEVIDTQTFVFALKGMPEIKLRMQSQTPNSEVVLGAASDKIPFNLKAEINEVDAENCTVQLHFHGEFNAMMAMMVKGPISNFIQTLASNMTQL
ncbi:MAG: orotate phosphoribosyltransferase [Flavobacterium sp. BFFFF2]|nr:MAG: orotate phosphoribosyltransferase [Flavobacterium sp. BFFFF2]